MNDSASAMYDSLAKHYRVYSEKRSEYLASVDTYILSNLPKMSLSLLDVGAGDGVRGMRIAKTADIRETVLCDSSSEMVQRCKDLGPSRVILCKAEDLPESVKGFDVVLMLWNVLGHLDSRSKRVEALRRIASAMTENSIFFLDVNNRHNASAYGWMKIFWRLCIDTIRPDETRGDVQFNWEIDGKKIPGKGHLFTLNEVRDLLFEAGLEIRDATFINYASGEMSRNRLRGQIVLKIGLKNKTKNGQSK